MELSEFLLARIAEDEAIADTIQARGGWKWREFGDSRIYGLSDDAELHPYFSIDLSRGCVYPTASVMAHITSHDPARVLAECDAKRQIVRERALWGRGKKAGLELALRFLAMPYADHPDYDPEWKP